MPDHDSLKSLLKRIDGRSYPAYKDLRGEWRLGSKVLHVDRVQGDPFAAPSRVRLRVPAGILPAVSADPTRRRAAEDWLLRVFASRLGGTRRGSGRSGQISVLRPGPDVSSRSAVRVHPDGDVEVRFTVGLPARGRRILGREAWALLTEDLAAAAKGITDVGGHPDLDAHVRSVCTQVRLRSQLRPRGLVAFVADGSILPRRSGVSQRPLESAVPFESPPSMRITLDGPSGPIVGMGVPVGVTVITGGGFHGKSTLLDALQRGHLDHVPGDGRERVVADLDAVKVRAEDGRRVAAVDVSAFLGELPGGRSTRPFATDDASGSTSQAASIVESVEAGARCLLFDEDTSATNLLVRDARMVTLIGVEGEPITPLVSRVRQLWMDRSVSTILVVGGVGDYLAVADTVVVMDRFLPREETARARALAGAQPPVAGPLPTELPRNVRVSSLKPTGRGRVRARDERRVDHGDEEIDLRAVEQVLDGAHAASLGHALRLMSELIAEDEVAVTRALDVLEAVLDAEGPDALSPFEVPGGTLVLPRRHEVAAALNRLRTLEAYGGSR